MDSKKNVGIAVIIGFLILALAVTLNQNPINISYVSNLPISENGFVEVELQDQYTEIIDLKLHQEINDLYL